MQDSMDHLIQATELDPSLLAAHVDLAHLCMTQELYGFLSPDIAAKHIRRIADTVQACLRPAHGPHACHGLGKISRGPRPRRGPRESLSASAQLPHSVSTTSLRVMFALTVTDFDEALDWLRSALLTDPYAPCLHSMHAWTLHLAEQAASSVETINKALNLFPDHESTAAFAALILSFNDRAEQGVKIAEDLVRRAPYFDLATAIHGYALAQGGRIDEARSILERLQWLSRERFVLSSMTAILCVALGDADHALSELQTAAESRCPWFFQALADPRLAPLHSHPEFARMRGILEQMEKAAEKKGADNL